MKFRAPDAGEVDARGAPRRRDFELVLSNLAVEETAARFSAILDEIVSRDPGELLIERIEANAADDSSTGSSLGNSDPDERLWRPAELDVRAERGGHACPCRDLCGASALGHKAHRSQR